VEQDFRRANLLNTRASRYEHALRACPSIFLPLKPQILKAACTPFQRRDVGVAARRRYV